VSLQTNLEGALLVSAEGYDQLCRELDTLRNRARRELAERLREARRDGHLDDNPTLQDLLHEQAQLERRIALLEAKLCVVEIAGPAARGRAGIGSVVRVRDEDGESFEYALVGPLEADIGNGRISISAPVGRALLGQRARARVDVATPLGPLTLHVLSVRARRAVVGEAA